MAERYQDYVIKDGKFVGKFEEMYQKFDDPWLQIEESVKSYTRNSTIFTIKQLGVKNVLESGCGLGYFTDFMHRNLPGVKIGGVDISTTAIEKASISFPELDFSVCDITTENDKMGGHDCIMLSEIMWYILQGIEQVISNIRASGARYLIINQTFYKGGQMYGREYFTTPEEMMEFLPFKVLVKDVVDFVDNASYDAHMVYQIQ